MVLNGTGMALYQPVVVLFCAAISLAAATRGPGGSGVGGSAAVNNDNARGKAGDDNDGNALTAMVSDFWWRADVSMEDITIARDELRKECTWEGGGDLCRKRTHF